MGYSPSAGFSVLVPASKGTSVKAHLELRHDKIVLWSEFELSWYVSIDLDNAEKLYDDLRAVLNVAGRDI